MIDTDYLVLAPWLIFAAGVVALVVLGLAGGRRRHGRTGRRRRRRPGP